MNLPGSNSPLLFEYRSKPAPVLAQRLVGKIEIASSHEPLIVLNTPLVGHSVQVRPYSAFPARERSATLTLPVRYQSFYGRKRLEDLLPQMSPIGGS